MPEIIQSDNAQQICTFGQTTEILFFPAKQALNCGVGSYGVPVDIWQSHMDKWWQTLEMSTPASHHGMKRWWPGTFGEAQPAQRSTTLLIKAK